MGTQPWMSADQGRGTLSRRPAQPHAASLARQQGPHSIGFTLWFFSVIYQNVLSLKHVILASRELSSQNPRTLSLCRLSPAADSDGHVKDVGPLLPPSAPGTRLCTATPSKCLLRLKAGRRRLGRRRPAPRRAARRLGPCLLSARIFEGRISARASGARPSPTGRSVGLPCTQLVWVSCPDPFCHLLPGRDQDRVMKTGNGSHDWAENRAGR